MNLKEEINKKYGKTIVVSGEEPNSFSTPRVSTGSVMLDFDTGGGVPSGKITEVYGKESSGKSFILYHTLASAQKKFSNLRVALFDLESSYEDSWASSIGIDRSKIDIFRPGIAETTLDIVEEVIQSQEYSFIGLDSVPALISQSVLDNSHEKANMAPLARLMSSHLQKVCAYQSMSWSKSIKDKKSVVPGLMYLNQTRVNLKVTFGDPETTPGGRALPFYASIRIRLSTEPKMSLDDYEVPRGFTMKYIIKKNKTAPPMRTGHLDCTVSSSKLEPDKWVQGEINNFSSLALIIKELKLVNITGSWFSGGILPSGVKLQGENQFGDYLKNLPKDGLDTILAKVCENSGVKIEYQF